MTQPPEPPAGSGAPAWPVPPTPGDWTAPGWAPPRHNGPAIASLVLGVLALPSVLFLWVGIVFGLVALALGLIGRGRVKRGEASAKGAATAGVVLGTLAVASSVALIATVYVLDQRNQDAYEECLRGGERPLTCVERYDPSEP